MDREFRSSDLHWEVEGEGRPLLFLHGFGSNLYCWRYLRKALADRYQLLLVDLKGFGASPKPRDGMYSVQDHARLIYESIVERDLKDLTLIGHSMGGGIALFTCLKLCDEGQTRRLRSLVLIDGVAYQQELPGYMGVLRIPALGELSTYLLPSRFNVGRVLKLCYYDPSRITSDQVPAYADPMNTPGGKYAVLRTARQLIPKDLDQLAKRYATITVPTLLLWGDHDPLVPRWVATKLEKTLPNCRLVIIPECGHIPQEEKPEETARILSEFLARSPQRPRAAAGCDQVA